MKRRGSSTAKEGTARLRSESRKPVEKQKIEKITRQPNRPRRAVASGRKAKT